MTVLQKNCPERCTVKLWQLQVIYVGKAFWAFFAQNALDNRHWLLRDGLGLFSGQQRRLFACGPDKSEKTFAVFSARNHWLRAEKTPAEEKLLATSEC
jgi:hypothetical protein